MADDRHILRQEVMDDVGQRVTVAERWSGLPRRRRHALVAGTASALVVTAAVVGFHQTREWLGERRLATQVDVRASIEVQSWSSPLAGDRVNFFANVHNAGSRQVRLTAIEIEHPRLRIRPRVTPRRPIPAGTTVVVPLSVLLDCTDPRPAGDGTAMRGTLTVSPEKGPARTVRSSFDHARLITDVADTVCRIRPALRGAELSGPVGRL